VRKHYLSTVLAGAFALAAFSSAHAQTAPMTAGRAAAVQECSILAGRYAETTYGNTEFYLYRSCMARHGQTE
jgi:hypothetical protein